VLDRQRQRLRLRCTHVFIDPFNTGTPENTEVRKGRVKHRQLNPRALTQATMGVGELAKQAANAVVLHRYGTRTC